MKQYYIYLITNNINGMKYIGKHYGELDGSYLGSGKLLKRAITKYGKDNFTKSILFVSKNEEENRNKEKEYISLYNATTNPLFYNIHEGGTGGNTIAGYTDEEKEQLKIKLSEVNRGEKNGMYGKSGDKALNGKRIEMYDKNWNLIKIFNAKTAVLQFLNLKGHTQLDKAIKN